MSKKMIVWACCIIFILLMGGCLFYKNPSTKLLRFEESLKKYGFKEINTHHFELIKNGLSQEEYLKSSSSTKLTNSLLFDTSQFVITKNEEETKFNYSKSISLNFDLKNLLISGYYNLNDEDMQEFTTAKYSLKDGNYKCDDSNCNLLKNEILTFIDEVNNILDDCHKTLNDFQK